jgi:hypothetical protein
MGVGVVDKAEEDGQSLFRLGEPLGMVGVGHLLLLREGDYDGPFSTPNPRNTHLGACSLASGQSPGKVAVQGGGLAGGGTLALPGGLGENPVAFVARHQGEDWGVTPPDDARETGPRSSDKDGPEVRGVTEARGTSPCILLPEGLRDVTITVLAVALLRHA